MPRKSHRIAVIAVVTGLVVAATIFALCAVRPQALSNDEVAAWALDRMWCAQEQALLHAFGSQEAACMQMSRRSHARRNNIQDLGGITTSAMLDDGVAFHMNQGVLRAKHSRNQEFWFEIIWYDAEQEEIVVLVTVLEQPFLQFDTEFPFVLLVRASALCLPPGPPSFSFASIGTTDHNNHDVSFSNFAPWSVERREDDLLVSLKGASAWVLPKPSEVAATP